MSKLGSSIEFKYAKVPDNETNKEQERSEVPETYGYGIRHIQLLLFFLTLVTSFIAKGHLGVTIVAMTSHKNTVEETQTAKYKENVKKLSDSVDIFDNEWSGDENGLMNVTESYSGNVNESRTLYSTFSWPKPIQEMALTSFFMGYCMMMLPLALVCQRWGGKVPLAISLLVNGVVSLLTPWITYWGDWKALCACRVLQGLSQAGLYPGLQTLLAQWVPECEKAALTSYVYTGATTGSVLAFQIGGILSDSFGWPAAFWAIGTLCLIMFTLLTFFGAKSPRVHNTISDAERKFITSQTQATVKSNKIPWKALVTTKPLLVNYLTACGSLVVFSFFFTQVPSYIHYIYGNNIKNSGLLTSLPYITSIFSSIGFGIFSDYVVNNNIMSKKNARRYTNLVTLTVFTQLGMGTALIGASYASNTTIAVIWFVVFMVSHMGVHTGWMINQIDLAPNYSGTIIAISSAVAHFIVMVMPLVVSNVIVDMENVFQWRIMFYAEAAIAVVPAIIFAVNLSTEVLPWNDGAETEKVIKSIKMENIEKNGVKNKETEKQNKYDNEQNNSSPKSVRE